MVQTHFSLAFEDYSSQFLHYIQTGQQCNNAKLPLKKFQQATATQLLEKAALLADDAPVRRSVGRPPANPVERLKSNKHLIDWVKDDRSCKVCSGPGNRKSTNFVCTGCLDRPHLHPKSCSKAYHSKVNFSQP